MRRSGLGLSKTAQDPLSMGSFASGSSPVGLSELAMLSANNAASREAYRTPSSAKPVREDPIAVGRERVLGCARRYADSVALAPRFKRVPVKTFERFSGTTEDGRWGTKLNRTDAYMCMPFVSEVLAHAYGGNPLYDDSHGRVALTKDMNQALAMRSPVPGNTADFNFYRLDGSDELDPDIPPGFVVINKHENDWNGHAGITSGNRQTVQAGSETGVREVPYERFGPTGTAAHPDGSQRDWMFTLARRSVNPQDSAEELYDIVSRSRKFRDRVMGQTRLIDSLASGRAVKDLMRDYYRKSAFLAEFDRMNSDRPDGYFYRYPALGKALSISTPFDSKPVAAPVSAGPRYLVYK